MGKRRGRCVRKNRLSRAVPEPETLTKAPHSFVIHRGISSKHTSDVTKDFRQVMEPFTATQLKERKNNSIKDFVSVAGFLHVSHLCIFSMTKTGMYFKVARLPRGPTLTFKVHNFCLTRDVMSSLKKQYFMLKAFETSPLIIMNGFSGEGMHLKLMANMFQNMFPTINVTNVQLRTIRRCVLLNYDPETKLIDFRHYYIKMSPVGLTRGTKKIVQGKVPNLKNCNDMSEFFEKAGLLSESEQEDDPNAQITLPQDLSGRGAKANAQSAVRLSELGPRLTLQLMKVEDGLLDGEVLFHELIHKTEEEKEAIRKMREIKKKLKEKRKKTQEENVKQKQEAKDKHKLKSLEGIKKKKEQTETERLMQLANDESQRENPGVDDDDAEYYRQAVGEEPEHDLFDKTGSKKRSSTEFSKDAGPPNKKLRQDNKVKGVKNSKFGYNALKKPFNKSNNESGKYRRNNPGFKDKNAGKKWKGGRGNNPKYGWRAQENAENNNHDNNKNKSNKKFSSKTHQTKDKSFKKGPNFKTHKKSFNKTFKKGKKSK